MEDLDTKDNLGDLVQDVQSITNKEYDDEHMEEMDQEDRENENDPDDKTQIEWQESTEAKVHKKDYRRADAGRRYREVWQELHPWVTRAVPDEEFAYCSACRSILRPRLTILVSHGKTVKHKQNWRRFQIEQQLVDNAVEEAGMDNKLSLSEDDNEEYLVEDGESIRTPRPAKKIVQTIGTQNAMLEPTMIKIERAAKNEVGEFENLDLDSDVEAIMEAVGPKVFEKLSIWEIMLHKATQSQDINAMDLVIKDVENILMEMKLLMNNCFDHVELTRRRTRDIVSQKKVGVNISKFLANAIEIDSGFWNQRDPEEVTCRNALELGLLIPFVSPDPLPEMNDIKKTKIRGKSKTTKRSRDSLDDPDYVARREALAKRFKSTKCPKCAKEYAQGETSKTHLPNCPAALKYKKVGALMYCTFDNCPNPEQEYKLREDILRHFDEHHFTDENRTIPCTYDDCTQMFATITLRNIHIRKNHEKLFSCEHCPKRFWSEKSLNDHIKYGHTVKENGDPPARAAELCRKCGKMMMRSYVSKHESKCTGYSCPNPQWKEIDGEFFCTVEGCQIKHGFSGMYGLRIHFFESHLDDTEKQFECEHCGKKFADRILFRKHVKAVHVKPYRCNLCTGRFGNKSQLAEHMYIHSGSKPHACDKCDFRSAKKSNLLDHKQKKHNDLGGRNYHCGICGKVFYSSGRLTSHFRIVHHDGLVEEKPKKKIVKRSKSMAKIILLDDKEKNMSEHAEQEIAVSFLMNADQADLM